MQFDELCVLPNQKREGQQRKSYRETHVKRYIVVNGPTRLLNIVVWLNITDSDSLLN